MTLRAIRRSPPVIVLLGVGGLLVVGLMRSTTTRQGVNFEVRAHAIPVYVKALSFLDRHYQYRLLAHEIVQGHRSDRERALALFTWTRQHIQPTPPGLPVIDDHILHIMIRGYGEDDQMADVFTTLSTYAGIPAFWRVVRRPGTSERLILSFARIEERWAVFDVANGFAFVDEQGRPADVQELLAHPALIQATTRTLTPDGIPYQQYLEVLHPFHIPNILRAEKQMPFPRLVFEAKRALHLLSASEMSEPSRTQLPEGRSRP